MKKPPRPDASRVFGKIEMDALIAGDSSKIRTALKFLKFQLSRGVSERAYFDIQALESALKSELSRRELNHSNL